MYLVVLTRKKLILLISLLVVLAVVTPATCGSITTFNKENNARELPIYSVKTDDKKIAISFDCAWGVDYTDKLLSIMETHGVKCTFFMVKFWVDKHPDYVKKISDAGHEIGTHSSSHPYMSKLSKEKISIELSSSIDAIENITKTKVTLFRPPYGDYNNLLIKTCREMGLYTIQWSIDSLDWKDLSAYQIKKRVLDNLDKGKIVLFHNQGLHTADALEEIIIAVKNQGYEFVPIGELIY